MFRTPEELLEILGQNIRNLRILSDLDQREVARRAGVALNAVKRLESGQPVTTLSFTKVLRVLNRVEWLNALAPEVSVNPILPITKEIRQKVFRERKKKADRESASN
jgi:transcriptional regulator with XRE-family HTH domain